MPTYNYKKLRQQVKKENEERLAKILDITLASMKGTLDEQGYLTVSRAVKEEDLRDFLNELLLIVRLLFFMSAEIPEEGDFEQRVASAWYMFKVERNLPTDCQCELEEVVSNDADMERFLHLFFKYSCSSVRER